MSSLDVRSLFGVGRKVALVTGGSRGIGKMIAAGFVKNGAKVYITARSVEDCETTARELNALGPGVCIPLPADLGNSSEIERIVAEIAKEDSALHVLVNNAGVAWAFGIDEYPDDTFTKVLMLNVQRVFTLTQKALPLLRAAAVQGGKDGKHFRDPARIINIGSIEGLGVPDHETYAYSASKAALHHLSRTLAGRLGPEGITSNTVACGPFETKMMAGVLNPTIRKYIEKRVPLSRLGTPEDVAGTTLFLASRAGAWVNGATIALEGGWLAHMPSVAKL
ncbi:NAD-P-binding protein [Gloeopeniophorella convolvens]|nr:NAD-P-binding protein [Gloeopeniophorella convolvens]